MGQIQSYVGGRLREGCVMVHSACGAGAAPAGLVCCVEVFGRQFEASH